MNEDRPRRLLVSRSLTRKVGESFEKIILQAEAALPVGLTLEEGFRDLNGTVLSALREAAESTRGSIVPRVVQHEIAETKLSCKLIETIRAPDGKPLGQIFLQDRTLLAKVFNGLRLQFQSAPIQSFLIPRVLDPMWNKKHIDSYEIQRTEEGYLTGIRVELVNNTTSGLQKQLKDLTNAIAWTLRRLSERPLANERGA